MKISAVVISLAVLSLHCVVVAHAAEATAEKTSSEGSGWFGSFTQGVANLANGFKDKTTTMFTAAGGLMSGAAEAAEREVAKDFTLENAKAIAGNKMVQNAAMLFVPPPVTAAIFAAKGISSVVNGIAHAKEGVDKGIVLDKNTVTESAKSIVQKSLQSAFETFAPPQVTAAIDLAKGISSFVGFGKGSGIVGNVLEKGEVTAGKVFGEIGRTGEKLLGKTHIPVSKTGKLSETADGNDLEKNGTPEGKGSKESVTPESKEFGKTETPEGKVLEKNEIPENKVLDKSDTSESDVLEKSVTPENKELGESKEPEIKVPEGNN